MNTIFMGPKSSKISDPHRLLLNLTDKIDLKKKILHLSYMVKNKKSYENNKFVISAPTWNEELELPDGSYLYQIFKIILNKS